ncbi:transcriptional regulator [Dehalococcoides mccartyi CG4]|uniref:helix-turn-helix domain-containing protein n=1 Tax=Dehalococcoides mccartyi TaxID=61435 RepID=UPI0004E0469D|nr:helix-turn-helix transcriptional regulator [Dehalococcoides mccartyi]AII59474.1 transcriptional regulator [Dehalococcoides mccartyi CG4]
MGVSYKKLWHLLIDRDLKKGDLCKMARVSGTSLAKMARGENVNTDTLVRICTTLGCTLDDISEIIPDDSNKNLKPKM